jgi:hypothetical protein
MIATLGEYIAEVDSRRREFSCPGTDAPFLWLRGHSMSSWELEPTLLRDSRPMRLTEQEYEVSLCEQFAARAPALVGRHFRNDLVQRITMQHHGVSTRLLDWTENALAALYFVVRNFKSTDDGTVHVLNASGLSLISDGRSAIQVVLSEATPNQGLGVLKNQLPVPIVPEYTNQRVAVQAGRFTVHPLSKGALDRAAEQWNSKHPNHGPLLGKIDVPGSAKENLFWELKNVGISEAVLFPDLDALGRELRSTLTSGETNPF